MITAVIQSAKIIDFRSKDMNLGLYSYFCAAAAYVFFHRFIALQLACKLLTIIVAISAIWAALAVEVKLGLLYTLPNGRYGSIFGS